VTFGRSCLLAVFAKAVLLASYPLAIFRQTHPSHSSFGLTKSWLECIPLVVATHRVAIDFSCGRMFPGSTNFKAPVPKLIY